MRVSSHLLASSVFSAGVYAATRSPAMTAASFGAGWLIDIDHVLDYVVEHGVRIAPAHFFATFRDDRYRRARLLLHGWEWPLGWLVGAALTGWHPLPVGIGLGWLHHLLFDQLTNTPSALGYSLLWRLRRGLSYRASFRGKGLA